MQTKKEKRKVLIALQTYDMLLEKGVDGFSLNNLLENISMSKGNFYHYFKNKDELFCETLKIALYNIYSKYTSYEELESFEEKLYDLFFLYLSKEKDILEYQSLVNQMYYLFSNEKNTYLYNFMQENYTALFSELKRIMEDEIKANRVKDDILHMIKPIVATADGMLTHSFMLKDYDSQSELKNYFHSISQQYQLN